MNKLFYLLFILGLLGCNSRNNNPGIEYSPQMYHGVAYYPLSQIKDENAGKWLSNREDKLGEFYNSNVNNPHKMNMRIPPKNVVKKTKNKNLPYRIKVQSIELAEKILKNPYDDSVISEGNNLYKVYCQHCHGTDGQGDGRVGKVYKGVPAYNKGRIKTLNEGHIFHVITYGHGRMGAHGSQIEIHERWKIVKYVQQLQKIE